MSNIADIAKVVLETDSLNADQKMTLLQSMLNNNTIENNNQANDTTNNGTFQVTVKPRSTRNRKSIYGNLRWEDDVRIEMFKVCKETFGHHDDWKAKTVPGNGIDYDDACRQIGEHFGRTDGAIKAQIRDVVMPIDASREKIRDSLERAKELALEAGFISEKTANS